MQLFLRMMMLFVACAGFLTACSSDGGGTAKTVLVTDSAGKTQTAMPITGVTGVTATIPKDLVLLDSSSKPVTGALTVETKYSTTATGLVAISGQTLSAYIGLTIKDLLGTEVKTFGAGSPAFTATLDVPGAIVGDVLNLYTSNDGQTWTADTITPTVTIATAGKATITITHLSYWGLFKNSVSLVTTTGKSVSGTVSDGTLSITDALVTLTAFDANNNKTDTLSFSTGSIGAFSNSLKLADAGGYVVVTVTKDGYTDYSKRIPFDAANDITLSALLDALPTPVVATPSDMQPMKASASIKAFTFGVFNNGDGTQRLVSGSKLKAAKAAGATADLELTIPQASVPGVNKLVGTMKSYDSSNAADAQKFPGDYVDNKGNKLVSLAFDSINISDENGKSIGEVVQKAMAAGKISKAALDANPTIINKHIPVGSCNMLLNDFCTGTATDDTLCKKLPVAGDKLYGKDIAFNWIEAFNVPIYSYDSYNGSWELIGIGTIDSNNDGDLTATDNTDKVDANSKPDVSKYKSACTANNGMYLKILVTSEKYKRSWWNLDYPLLFDTPKEVCIGGTFKDSTGASLNGWLNLSSRIASSGSASVDKDGKFTIKSTMLDKTETSRAATIGYYDEFNNIYQSVNVTLGDWNSTTKTCGATPKDIFITRPKRCDVTGTLLNEGATAGSAGTAKADAWLYIYASQPYFGKSILTDKNGAFSAKVACDQTLDINYGGTSVKQFKATDTTTALGNIIIANQPPQVSGFFNSGAGIIVGGTSKITFNAYDADGNYPLTWKVEVKDSKGAVAKTYASDATNKISTGSSPNTLEITGLVEGSYDVVVTITDLIGKSGSYSIPRKLDVASQNRAPIINRYGTVLVNGQGITMESAASDLETDAKNLKYVWTVKDATGSVLSSPKTATAFYPVPAETADKTVFTVELTVSDDGSYFDGTTTKIDAAKIKSATRSSTLTYSKVPYSATVTIQ